jgi:hypothetical protein
MTGPLPADLWSQFPISGLLAAEFLAHFFEADEFCYVDDIETLSSVKSPVLGQLWHTVTSGITVCVKFKDFARVISLADQVVSLSLSRSPDQRQRLVIEDGYFDGCSL